jgi:carbamoyl-phosphate synthase large subunit
MNILFTCAGRRNYLINYFKEALNGGGKVVASDMELSAPALIDADIAIQTPSIYDENYLESLRKIIKENKIKVVIPLNDMELPILSIYKDELELLGTEVIISDIKVINICFDKWETYKFFEKIGLKSPKTFIDIEEVKKAIKIGDLKFPLVVKPRWGSGSIGIDFPENLEELELAYKLQKIKLSRTILNEVSQEDFERAILIQEKIEGIEFGMDVLNDFKGNYYGTFVRQKLLMRSGETDKAVSIIDEKFNKIGEIISENLKHVGNLDCDIFEYMGELYVLELNPRFGGGYPFSHEAGNNTAAIFIDWFRKINDVSKHSNYKAGIMFSKCDRLLDVSLK